MRGERSSFLKRGQDRPSVPHLLMRNRTVNEHILSAKRGSIDALKISRARKGKGERMWEMDLIRPGSVTAIISDPCCRQSTKASQFL